MHGAPYMGQSLTLKAFNFCRETDLKLRGVTLKYATMTWCALLGEIKKMKVSANARVQHTVILSKCSLFSGIAANEIEHIVTRMNILTVPRGRLIMQNGDHTTDVFFLISGTAIGQLVADSGRQILFTEMASGEYFGELAALDGGARSITISASSECIVATLSKSNFRDILLDYPQIGINLATELGARLRGMNERVFGLMVHDVETRVGRRLLQLAQSQEQLVGGGQISDAPTHEGIANFVGSNREAVSRSIARLNKAGIIETDRKKVVILDLDRLLAIAGGDAG